jgi:hypothetical protein
MKNVKEAYTTVQKRSLGLRVSKKGLDVERDVSFPQYQTCQCFAGVGAGRPWFSVFWARTRCRCLACGTLRLWLAALTVLRQCAMVGVP